MVMLVPDSAHPPAVHLKVTLSAVELIDCFEWPWSSEEAARDAGFGESAVRSARLPDLQVHLPTSL